MDPISPCDAELSVTSVFVEDGVLLRVFRWLPMGGEDARGDGEDEATRGAVVFVAGWVSSIEGWIDVLQRLVRTRPVYYIETREKHSAEISARRTGDVDFGIPRMGLDLNAAITGLGLSRSETTLVGSSLGASAILEALKADPEPAHAAFLIGPNAYFSYPWWGDIIVHMPTPGYHIIKHLVIFYLRHFRVDTEAEPQQMERYERTLLRANPLRIKLSAQRARFFEVWDGLERVETPVCIAYASSDRLHEEGAMPKLAEALPRSKLLDCESNKLMHRAPIVDELDAFLAEVESAGGEESR